MNKTKQVKNNIDPKFKVHSTINNRKIFKTKMILRFLLLLIILAGCAVMVMFGGWKWDPDAGFSPTTDPKQPYQYALIWIGSILAILSIIGYVIWTIKTFKKFYSTQEEYFKTQDFKDKKAKALATNISKLNKSTIKWYKKMGYIDSAQKTEMIERLKDIKKKK